MTDQLEMFDSASTLPPTWCFDCRSRHLPDRHVGAPAWCSTCIASHRPGEHTRDLAELEAESRMRTAEAIRRVDVNAEDAWKAAADEAIRFVATEHGLFTADEVWRRLEALEVPAPHEPRALGARLQAAARHRLIENAGAPVKSKRPETHGSWVASWRSLIAASPGGTPEGGKE